MFYVNEPVINMKENPSNEAKIVSQAIFTENVTIQDQLKDWSFIQTADHYTGWILSKSLVYRIEPYQTNAHIARLNAHLYPIKDIEYGCIERFPYGLPYHSKLQVLDITDNRWVKIRLPDGFECFIQKGDLSFEHHKLQKNELVEFSHQFLNLPYIWGGRSSFGYDCSGFVQMLYCQMGINLPRDSKQQVLDSRFQSSEIEDLEPGDLIFFGKAINDIRHVGMYIGKGTFIHATSRENQPWIRISSLTDLEWSGRENVYYPYRSARQLISR
jgi:gamma-D-glutamyl-L-lysine dipeptidyl-peptidase